VLGATANDVEVVMRHSGSTVDAAPEPHAAYDVRVKADATSFRRHFGAKADSSTRFRFLARSLGVGSLVSGATRLVERKKR
jgi:hypothetical protein